MTTTTEVRQIPSSDYDPFTAEAMGDEMRYDGALRDIGSIVYLSKYDVYAVTRQATLRKIGRDRKTYSNKERPFDENHSPFKPRLMILQDPPEHTAIKKQALDLFSKAVLEDLDATFQAEAERRIAELMSDGPVEIDAVNDIAMGFITKVFLDALGAPEEGRELLTHFADAALNSTAPKNDHYRRKHAIGQPALAWVEDNMKRETASRSGWGKQVYEKVDQGLLTETEGEQLVKLIFAAGFDTTTGSISNAILSFADNPEQYEILKADPSLVDNTIEEVLRYYPPVRFTGRVATKDNEVDGYHVPEGALMMMMWICGGRDPEGWENPDAFDIRREGLTAHMTFGVGIHACLGQHVARMETRAVLNAFIKHVDKIESTGRPTMTDNMQGFGHATVPVRLTPVGR